MSDANMKFDLKDK